MAAAAGGGDDRLQLAKHCRAREWSKAIRTLDSLLARSPSVQDYCNRAFCYSKLDLNKHVIVDCDKALGIDQGFLQAYILKGNALSALGREEDALHVWEEGYEHAGHESTDLKLLLEVEELLTSARKRKTVVSEVLAVDDSGSITSTSAAKAVDSDPSNAIISVLDKDVACEDHDMVSSSTVTRAFDISFEIQTMPDSFHDVLIGDRSNDTTETCVRSSKTIKIGQNVFGASKLEARSLRVDFQLSRGIAKVNEGKYDEAISTFDQILTGNPLYIEALIGRGTARAFQSELGAAIADFTEAIKANPSAGEAWKRRGQARAALGDYFEALEDMTKALEWEPGSLDILLERGIVKFKFQDYAAAVEDLSECILHDKMNKSAYTYLGLALSSIGDYDKAKEAHLESIKLDNDFIDGWTHLAQYYQDLANPQESLACLQQVLRIDGRFSKAHYLRGLLYHGLGEHRIAIDDLSLGLSFEESNIECLYWRASCHQAIGEYEDAVKDYDLVLRLGSDSDEKFTLQCLAFYQKEIALYTASKINSEFSWYDVDRDVKCIFKEYWCKRAHPKEVSEKVVRQPSLRSSAKKDKLRRQEFVPPRNSIKLLQAADIIGKNIQYNCTGFLPNKRQYRMAGLAAIEIAQLVSKAWRSLFKANPLKRTKKRGTFSTTGQHRTFNSSEASTSNRCSEDRSTFGQSLSWQDVYSIAVKWRQISEPCDPVFWINKLSENFTSELCSHTPMLLGQAKVPRYYPNYRRTISTAVSIMSNELHVHDFGDNIVDISGAESLQSVLHAESCSDLYNAVGRDFWVATTCKSTAFEGKYLEGTRIDVTKKDTRGFTLGIKTPCTTSRWNDYDAEMTKAWEALCNAYCGEVHGSDDMNLLGDVKDAILRITYYWYNFMPLTRGSAVVGYTVLLGLFLAANMEVTAKIPPGFQVDWEAIFSPKPEAFLDCVKDWLYPSLGHSTLWRNYPDVTSTFYTTRSVVTALSSYDQ